jgi:D-glycero-D-manno-heptose 1,7-bisphosphate phosphatase
VTRIILLDRDGVINRDSADYIKSAAEFVPIAGSIEAMARLSGSGLQLGICTNQSGIRRCLLSESDLQEIFAKLKKLLADHGALLPAIAHCPHLPDDGCNCRKPQPGMLLMLMEQLNASAAETLFVGDSLTDIQAALAAGCQPVLVRTGKGRVSEADARKLGVTEVYDSLADFAAAEIARQQMMSAQQ